MEPVRRLSMGCLAFVVFAALTTCVQGCPKKAATQIIQDKPPQYEGCFEDKRNSRDLGTLAGFNQDLTKKLCEESCRKYKLPYFGLQEGIQCWCGNEFGIHGKAEEALCAVRCAGQPEERCGGQMHNSVYKIMY